MQKKYESTLEDLTSIMEQRDALVNEKATSEKTTQAQSTTITGLHAQLAAAGTEIGNQKRQIQNLQYDLRAAQKRADDSERTQRRLQNEGTNLMRSLDELRPKVVELTEDKVELSEQLARLEHALRDRDNIISNLEVNLGEVKLEKDSLRAEWMAKLSRAEQERSQTATSSSEMEKGFSELQREHENALDGICTLELERQSLRQEAQNRLQEVEQLMNNLRSQAAEITHLQYELNERRAAQVSTFCLIAGERHLKIFRRRRNKIS
jgi:myosin protein heavy chain